MSFSLSSLPPELWDSVLSYLTPGSLNNFSLASSCCSQMVRSQVNHRITYYLSPKAPFKLQMMLLNPEGWEVLDLTGSRDPVKGQYFHTPSTARINQAREGNCTRFKLSRSQTIEKAVSASITPDGVAQAPTQGSYKKKIHIDELDFLYQMCFAIHKCKTESNIYGSNFCGGRMKMIRLLNDWLTPRTIQYNINNIVSELRVFTKFLWTDPASDVGFILSAYRGFSLEQGCHIPCLGHFAGSRSTSKLFRIGINEVVIRDNYLLALFEGFNI